MQEEALASVIAILGCPRSTARSLLMHFRWNTETLFGARCPHSPVALHMAGPMPLHVWPPEARCSQSDMTDRVQNLMVQPRTCVQHADAWG